MSDVEPAEAVKALADSPEACTVSVEDIAKALATPTYDLHLFFSTTDHNTTLGQEEERIRDHYRRAAAELARSWTFRARATPLAHVADEDFPLQPFFLAVDRALSGTEPSRTTPEEAAHNWGAGLHLLRLFETTRGAANSSRS
jgi:hypothetical protein